MLCLYSSGEANYNYWHHVHMYILFTWQTSVGCVTSAKLKHFIEPYHAPHNFNYRFVHAFFYLLFIFNISGNPSINLSAVALVTGDILFYKENLGRIFWTSAVDIIEMVCYINILAESVSLITAFCAAEKNQP